ncbi:unnamed protein product [Urochloa decumbens]|uniref:DUF1618 domain-containing protein n=1 Tax=Urochloa decumbens TaxID=240449 RepID=A0ABC9EK02_9POAL
MATAAAARPLPPPPAFPAAPPIRAGWTLFDPFVVTEDFAAAAAVANDDTSAAACCVTRCGRDVRVSLRLADPPAASYVVMRADAELHGKPKVVAADGDLLLIEMAVVEPPSTVSREQNFLVCFVDYHRGILLCDVFAASPELRSTGRSTSASKGGVMRFVDVSDGLFGRRRHPYAVTVTTWTLRAAEVAEWEWEKDGVLQVGDLWNSCEFRRSPLPRRAPVYPAVCKHGTSVVGFANMDWNSSTKDAWVIVVDVREMELLAYAPYTNQAKEGEVNEEGYEVVAGCLFHDTPFICSDIFNYKTFAPMDAGSD